MDVYGWNARCLLRNGRPWFPVMGEFQFSRYPRTDWGAELAKIKAGGVSIVATYIFWLHHEPVEGMLDFDGGLSLRTFVEACRDAGMPVWLRPGPWCHGEARNGGFPDWLLQQGWTLRSNDPRYMEKVRLFWNRIAREVDGLLHEQGGPVIGVQLENEYGHAGGTGDPAHVDALLALARESGMRVPYYSATGWGGASIGTGDTDPAILPVMGAYCEAPWDRRTTELPANNNYLFSPERNDTDIGSDFRVGEHLTFDAARYPFLTAELGGGMMGTYNRRPYTTGKDIGALSTVKMGSGASLLGYYVYHGGTNPGPGLNETRASGGFCDWPEMTYDLRAPIGEYGQFRDAFKEIKLLAMFGRDFGDQLADLPLVMPDHAPTSPEDMDTPRYALRADGRRAFVFVNNYQRRRVMTPKTLDLAVPLDGGAVALPTLRLADGDYAFYPVNMRLGDAVLKTARATPLCSLNDATYVFYADGDPAYRLDGAADLLTLSRHDALNATKIRRDGRDALVVADAPLIERQNGYAFWSDRDVPYTVHQDGARHHVGVARFGPGEASSVAWRETETTDAARTFTLTPRYADARPADADVFLTIDYAGAAAELWVDDRNVADDYFDGHPWAVSLRRFGFPTELTLIVRTLREDEPVYLDRRPVFTHGNANEVRAITAADWRWIDGPGDRS